MILDLFYEDGFAAYLNGNLVASSNLPDTLAYDSISTARREIREGDPMVSFAIDFSGKLRRGENLLLIAADEAQISIEFSPDLENWQNGSAVYLGSNEGADGVTLRHWRAPMPVTSGTPVRYARLVLTAKAVVD